MRFKQFVSEDKSFSSIEEIASAINKNCQEFLSETDFPIYRGYDSAGTAFEKSHPVDRKSRDSVGPQGLAFNWVFNAMMSEAFNVPQIRRRSVFATHDMFAAVEYGIPHYFFPKGDFKLVWSAEIDDSYGEEYKFYQELLKSMQHFFKVEPTPVKPATAVYAVIALLKNLTEVSSNPTTFLASSQGADVLLAELKTLFGRKFKVTSSAEAMKLFKESLVDAADQLGYREGDLDVASAYDCELLFYETDGYIMVPVDSIGDSADNYTDFLASIKNAT